MGLKRPFNAEEVQELNIKHARQLSYCNKPTQLDAVVPYEVYLESSGFIGEDMNEVEGTIWSAYTNHVNKKFETSSSEEDAGSGSTIQSSLSHESPESDSPWMPFSPVGDVNSFPPEKQVLIGPMHQAEIPEFVGRSVQEESRDQSHIVSDEERLMGTCIIQASDSDIFGISVCKTGKGREDCLCWDKGSIRCVQQHIMEAREDVTDVLGHGNFLKLGLCEMGEEIARKWTEEEEDLFHETVYSNPVSLGRDFWKSLKEAFPLRPMKELVSYYFNVFILQRRAVQNRYESLEVDSDDDEWKVEYDSFNGAQASSEHEDSFMESLLCQHAGGEEYKDSDSNEGDYSGHLPKDEEKMNMVEDDSCMSFEFQSDSVYSRSPRKDKERSDVGKCWCHRFGSGELVNQLYSYDDDCSARLSSPWTKSVELLPTSNMMDEIFGQDDDDDDDAWEDNNISEGK